MPRCGARDRGSLPDGGTGWVLTGCIWTDGARSACRKTRKDLGCGFAIVGAFCGCAAARGACRRVKQARITSALVLSAWTPLGDGNQVESEIGSNGGPKIIRGCPSLRKAH